MNKQEISEYNRKMSALEPLGVKEYGHRMELEQAVLDVVKREREQAALEGAIRERSPWLHNPVSNSMSISPTPPPLCGENAGAMGDQMNEIRSSGWHVHLAHSDHEWTVTVEYSTPKGLGGHQKLTVSHALLDTAVAMAHGAWGAALATEKLLTK